MKLKLRGKSYPISIGKGTLAELPAFVQKNKFRKVYLLSDADLIKARITVKKLFTSLPIQFHEIPLLAGERLKDIQSVYTIYGELLKLRADRDSLLIALGGGSIGDAVGFVASTYLRGLPWVGIPTTLLAQVDSSVGGKTGINHESGKNLIGTFHQPSLVLCDTRLLSTLGPREIASGAGEIAKYGITFDLKFFQYLEKNLEVLLNLNPEVTQYAIKQSLRFKCKAVMQDEFDRKGAREVLNFGHTFGHALEALTLYETYQHGEAVVWGMRFATALSVVRGHLNEKTSSRIDALLERIPVPPLPKKLDGKLLFQTMKLDKKVSQGKIRFVLIKKIGESVSDREVTKSDLERAFRRIES